MFLELYFTYFRHCTLLFISLPKILSLVSLNSILIISPDLSSNALVPSLAISISVLFVVVLFFLGCGMFKFNYSNFHVWKLYKIFIQTAYSLLIIKFNFFLLKVYSYKIQYLKILYVYFSYQLFFANCPLCLIVSCMIFVSEILILLDILVIEIFWSLEGSCNSSVKIIILFLNLTLWGVLLSCRTSLLWF